MGILSPEDRETVRRHLQELVHDVRLLLFTQTIGGPETAEIAREILREVSELNERVTFEEVNFVLERDRAAAYGVEAIPALVVLRDGADTRMRFLGAPSGYEFMSLIEAIISAGTEPELSEDSRALVAAVVEPTDIKVFVTPTCPHCPRAVNVAHKMALANPLITATCVEATEFMELTRKYRVTGVPKTVVNDRIEILGALPELEFVRAALAQPPSATEA